MRSMRPRHSSSYSSSSRARRAAPTLGADDLAPPDALLGDQPGPLEDGDVLLHGGEAHGVVRGQLRDALLGLIARRTMSRRVASARAEKMRSKSTCDLH